MKIVAVTACPSGVAHTYMAAEALKKAGEKLRVEIKLLIFPSESQVIS